MTSNSVCWNFLGSQAMFDPHTFDTVLQVGGHLAMERGGDAAILVEGMGWRRLGSRNMKSVAHSLWCLEPGKAVVETVVVKVGLVHFARPPLTSAERNGKR